MEDASLIAAWLRGVLSRDASVDPGALLGNLCRQHGWTTFQDELRELFENTSAETLERHARLLADLTLRKDADADRRRLCSQLATLLMSAMERWDPNQSQRDWRTRSVDPSLLLPPLVQALLVLEEVPVFERLITCIFSQPRVFDLTTVQVPALLGLQTWLKQHVRGSFSPLNKWLSAIHAELETRASHAPKMPADWRRDSDTGCNCGDCQQLGRFLSDPGTRELRIPLPEPRRKHLHRVIDGKKLDTTHVTERRGRPYTLVCTKTYASYERALKAHNVDLVQLEVINWLRAWHAGLPSESARTKGEPAKSPRKRTKGPAV